MTVLSNIITPSNVLTTTNTATVTNKTLTSPTVTGMVVSDGTANGVTYLNGSKVLTSGSALTFDGTNFANTGNITAGTTSSGANLVAYASTYGSNGLIRVFGTDGNNKGAFNASSATTVTLNARTGVSMIFEANDTEQMRLTSTGLGIGTSSPAEKLNINGGNIRVDSGNIKINNSGGRLEFLNGSGSASYFLELANANNDLQVNDRTGLGAVVLTIKSGGNVGIGTSSPTSKLGVNGVIQVTGGGNPSSGAGWEIGYGTVNAGRSALQSYNRTGSAFLGADYNSLDHYFYTSGTERARIDSSGNLNIGTTGSSNRLEVASSTNSTIGITRIGSHNVTLNAIAGGAFTIGQDGSGGGTERMRIDSSGNLLVGTTSAIGSERLNVTQSSGNHNARIINSGSSGNIYGPLFHFSAQAPNNNVSIFLICSDNSATRASILSNGGISNYSANNVNLSDRREKTNFAPAKSYLDVICSIPVQTYNYIDQNLEEDAGLTLGVVAQDVQAIAPELVSEANWGTEEDPKMRLSIYQTDLQYALMKCIQEQQALIQSLKARLDAANL